jgi:hypothetical protein
MNLDDFERTSRTVSQSSLTLTLTSEMSMQDADHYVHQIFPSFLNESFDHDGLSMNATADHQESSKQTQFPNICAAQDVAENDICDNGATPSITDDCLASPPKIAPLVQLYHSRPRIPNSASFAVVNISNISPETTVQDIDSFCSPVSLIHGHISPYFTEAVHLIFASSERPQVKNQAFVEFPTEEQALSFIQQAKRVFKKRVCVSLFSISSSLLRLSLITTLYLWTTFH